jgi:hypothetical protein
MKPVSYPAGFKVLDFTETLHTFSNIFDFVYDFRLNVVKKAGKHKLARTKDYFKDVDCGSVAKIFFSYFEAIIGNFIYHFLDDEND